MLAGASGEIYVGSSHSVLYDFDVESKVCSLSNVFLIFAHLCSRAINCEWFEDRGLESGRVVEYSVNDINFDMLYWAEHNGIDICTIIQFFQYVSNNYIIQFLLIFFKHINKKYIKYAL